MWSLEVAAAWVVDLSREQSGRSFLSSSVAPLSRLSGVRIKKLGKKGERETEQEEV